jgi:hypothetical protein
VDSSVGRLLGGLLNRVGTGRASSGRPGPAQGPEEAFRREVLQAAEQALHIQEQGIHVDVDELARLYAKAGSAAPTDEHPLPADHRAILRQAYTLLCKLRKHPLMPFKESNPVLNAAFAQLGWAEPQQGPVAGSRDGELGPVDVLRQKWLVGDVSPCGVVRKWGRGAQGSAQVPCSHDLHASLPPCRPGWRFDSASFVTYISLPPAQGRDKFPSRIEPVMLPAQPLLRLSPCPNSRGCPSG